jgi:hypothetical protein
MQYPLPSPLQTYVMIFWHFIIIWFCIIHLLLNCYKAQRLYLQQTDKYVLLKKALSSSVNSSHTRKMGTLHKQMAVVVLRMDTAISSEMMVNQLSIYMAPFYKRLESSSTLLWKHQILHCDRCMDKTILPVLLHFLLRERKDRRICMIPRTCYSRTPKHTVTEMESRAHLDIATSLW